MGTVATVISEWVEDDIAKEELYKRVPGLVLRWINEAQDGHVDKSEVLQDVWQPTITSSGSIALPANFLREVKDNVKWDTVTRLVQIDYPSAALMTFSVVEAYSIWKGTFYVWVASAGTPSIPYIKKPVELTTIASDSLEIPSEMHNTLQIYLDAKWAHRNKDYNTAYRLMQKFEENAAQDGNTFRNRRNPVPTIRSSIF